MPVYNAGPHLETALASIVGQSYANLDIVVIDDGSTDGSSEILRRFAASDGRIRLFEQSNQGVTPTLIRGMAEALGAIIARMDADDVSAPDRIEKQLGFLLDYPDHVAVSTRLEYLPEAGDPWLGRTPADPHALRWITIFYNRLGGHGQMMFRREAYARAGGYDSDFRYAQDHDLWARLLLHGPIATLAEPLYGFRLGNGSISSRCGAAQLACSQRVTCREFRRLTGRELGARALEGLRAFWLSSRAEPIAMADAGEVDSQLRAAYGHYLRSGARHAAEPIRREVAERWLFLGAEARRRREQGGIRHALRAIRWNPRVAPRAMRMLARAAG